jgi:hypothetical protein
LKLKSIAPKLRGCGMSWRKSKAKTNPTSAFLLPDVFQARIERRDPPLEQDRIL